ncbi:MULTISPECIES: Sec-independent protein translocase subunit TatA [Thermocrispum]|jgi:sec-independent protein translocase protein TatA|uniref:Sec-independent protein translocase protein TatA n=1 Tax=Thermocrispum agreste TaxID=37925 RepID=A0A2W4LS56_9PSEU|nr:MULTISPECIES: Sec-independent protein translocase subunit TatA [Thermocrispum]PZM98536.1 MAG: twin-arginine translocase TatA/TatE family subunit [Thermocrispum agreste]
MGSLSPWHLLILVAVLVLLFGAKKLPDAARAVGRSLKILKAETKDMRGEADDTTPGEQPAAKALPSAQAPAAGVQSTEEKVAELQRQLDELKQQQKNAG